jgi:hypothetical protein
LRLGALGTHMCAANAALPWIVQQQCYSQPYQLPEVLPHSQHNHLWLPSSTACQSLHCGSQVCRRCCTLRHCKGSTPQLM